MAGSTQRETVIEQYERKKRERIAFFHALKDYVIGTVILLIGFVFLFYKKLKIPFLQMPASWVDVWFGAICILYGAWRIYRGYKKNYFR